MADIRVTLNTRQDEIILVDPIPEGLDDIVIQLMRDDESHGMFFEYGIDRLTFSGQAAEALETEYEAEGVNGFMGILIEYMCSEVGQYEEVTSGGLDFGTYERLCGLECSVSIELEPQADVMRFRNNYDQKVDLLKAVALDGQTPLTDYAGLNFDMIVPGRELRERLQGTAQPGNFPIYPINTVTTGLFTTISVRPSYTENQVAELQTPDLVGASNYRVNPQNDPPLHPTVISPVLDFTQAPGCTAGLLNYKIRFKGHVAETGSNNRSVHIQLVFNKGDYLDTTDPAIEKISIAPTQTYLGPDGPNLDFDETFTGVVPASVGDVFRVRIFSAVVFNGAGKTTNLYVTWDAETSIELWANTLCPATTSKVFAINEAFSRVAESITNDQIRVFSDFFGRTDSQPYARPVDSCAGMETITSGLNIRRKLLPNGEQPGFFKSFRELYDDHNSMWNIGFTIQQDPERTGFNRLRIENWEYFYQNQVVLTFPHTTQVKKNVDLSRVYNQLLIGFEKWEAQRNTGLDEFMTQRTYRIDINTINNVLDRMCQMILSTYCIEETRRLRDNTQDWTYDNDTFGFMMQRGEGTLNMTVEMMADSAVQIENILNPGSCYNHRRSPARNAMRWFNFIMQGLKVLDASKKMWFSEGKGNYVAAYKLLTCFIEGTQLQENDNIDINYFADGVDAYPITFAETDFFEHPLSFSTFRRLKNEPDLMFKAIRYYCNGVPSEGWIKLISYRLNSGMAEITTIPKNTLQIPVPQPPCGAMIENIETVSCGEGCTRIQWDDAVGDNWRWTLYDADTNLPIEQGTTVGMFVDFEGLSAGSYSFQVIPYCGDSSGQNIGQVGFNVEPVPFLIELSAQRVFRDDIDEWKWMIVAEPVNYPTFQQAGHFYVKICWFNFVLNCNTEDGGDQGEIEIVVGSTLTTTDTWGSTGEDATLVEVRIKDLTGLTQDQVTKKAGETWTLTFV